MKLLKKGIVYLIIILAIIMFGNIYNNKYKSATITISSKEMNNKDLANSEYINIDYTGDKQYVLEFQIWENGKFIKRIDTMERLNLSEYEGISFEIELLDNNKNNIIFTTYNKNDTATSCKYYLPKLKLNTDEYIKMESDVKEKIKINDTENIGIWGVHYNKSTIPNFTDSLDAAKKMNYSFIAILVPRSQDCSII